MAEVEQKTAKRLTKQDLLQNYNFWITTKRKNIKMKIKNKIGERLDKVISTALYQLASQSIWASFIPIQRPTFIPA